MSAPRVSETFCGAMTLPFDLDILRPLPSTTKPCVRSALYGARPSIAQPVSSELWNQPRCWSEPSRYMSAGYWQSARCEPRITERWVVPESNHTSSVSFILTYWSASSPSKSFASSENQASIPDFSTRSATCSVSSAVRGCSFPFSLCRKKGIGTPQLRWRETHQSGRPLIIASSRARPQAGKNSVASTAFSAICRSVDWPSLA